MEQRKFRDLSGPEQHIAVMEGLPESKDLVRLTRLLLRVATEAELARLLIAWVPKAELEKAILSLEPPSLESTDAPPRAPQSPRPAVSD